MFVGLRLDGIPDVAGHRSDAGVLQAQVNTVMTRNPITIRQGALAVEALKIFQQRQIDDLIVVDDNKRPVGIVDSQDLPKFKIM